MNRVKWTSGGVLGSKWFVAEASYRGYTLRVVYSGGKWHSVAMGADYTINATHYYKSIQAAKRGAKRMADIVAKGSKR